MKAEALVQHNSANTADKDNSSVIFLPCCDERSEEMLKSGG